VDDPEVVHRYFRDLAKRTDLLWVGHNFKFDLHMMENDGVVPQGLLACTMVNAALIDEEAGRYGLEECSIRAGVQPKKGDALYAELHRRFKDIGCPEGRKSMAFFHYIAGDDPIAVDYTVGDGTSTWQLFDKQLEAIAAEELERAYDLECRVLRTIQRMERRGVRVDEERLEALLGHMNRVIAGAQKRVGKNFNPRSSTQMRDRMKKYQHEWRKTPKGAPSFPEEWLIKYPEGRDIVDLRKATNLVNSFIIPLKERHIVNGRVHTSYNQLKQDDYGVVTGRLSSSDPNLQQVPKRDKHYAPLFRALFVPDKGTTWRSNDYRQQEYVVFAEYTKAPRLIEGYNAEPMVDIHQVVADMCGVPRDPDAKRINLGKLYGMGLPKLAVKLNKSIDEVRDINRRYEQMFPESKGFRKKAERLARQRGWVKSMLGRRRHFPDTDYAHKAGNAVIAMCSADITKLKMVEIDEFFVKQGIGSMQLQVHDELDWFTPKGNDGDRVDEEARRIMQDFGEGEPIHLALVPLRIDAKPGADWAEATFGVKYQKPQLRKAP
jgi:DNA polymerase-1